MNKAVIREALDLLRQDGYSEIDSCTVGGEMWKCSDCDRDEAGKCLAQRMNEERFELIKRLSAA